MAFLRKSIDSLNGEIQFEVDSNANSINMKFDALFIQDAIDGIKVRVERVQKNKSNTTLYTGLYSDLKSLLKFAFPVMANILPFAVAKSLILNDDDKLLITLTLPDVDLVAGITVPTSFEYEINETLLTTPNPLTIKTVAIDEELSFNTEFYPLLLLSKSVDSYEAISLSRDQATGYDVPTKIFYGKGLINSSVGVGADFLPMVTVKDQKVTVKGTTTVYLILI